MINVKTTKLRTVALIIEITDSALTQSTSGELFIMLRILDGEIQRGRSLISSLAFWSCILDGAGPNVLVREVFSALKMFSHLCVNLNKIINKNNLNKVVQFKYGITTGRI